MSYCKISKEMSSLYFEFDVFFQFEARVPGFDVVLGVRTMCTVQAVGGQGLRVNFWDSSLK
jgi:hypothetical protein